MRFSTLDFPRRCLVVGAGAGVVLELSLIAGFLWSKRPGAGGFTAEMTPFVVLSGLAFAVGAGAFVVAIAYSLRPAPKRKKRRR